MFDQSKHHKRTKAEIDAAALSDSNLYELLGLEKFGMDSTEKQIAKAYRKKALTYHPDKLGEKITEDDKAIWLEIQKAYETLMDPKKKKEYDSTLPFDESVPKMTDISNDAQFFEEFGKCFSKNAKFSNIKPVPAFGFGSMDLKDVHAFYKFWDNFKTWRTFNQYDEYEARDVEQAEDRFERRWMEKENAKCRKKYDILERKRLFKLVALAYDNDPRILAEQKKAEEAKQAKKDAKKINAQKKYRDADAIKEAEAAAKKEAEEIEAKRILEEKAAKKEAGKKYRLTCKEFNTFCCSKMPGSNLDRWFIEELVKKFPTQEKMDGAWERIRTFDDATFEASFQDFADEQDKVKWAKKQELLKK